MRACTFVRSRLMKPRSNENVIGAWARVKIHSRRTLGEYGRIDRRGRSINGERSPFFHGLRVGLSRFRGDRERFRSTGCATSRRGLIKLQSRVHFPLSPSSSLPLDNLLFSPVPLLPLISLGWKVLSFFSVGARTKASRNRDLCSIRD